MSRDEGRGTRDEGRRRFFTTETHGATQRSQRRSAPVSPRRLDSSILRTPAITPPAPWPFVYSGVKSCISTLARMAPDDHSSDEPLTTKAKQALRLTGAGRALGRGVPHADGAEARGKRRTQHGRDSPRGTKVNAKRRTDGVRRIISHRKGTQRCAEPGPGPPHGTKRAVERCPQRLASAFFRGLLRTPRETRRCPEIGAYADILMKDPTTRRQRGRYGNEQRTQRATVPPNLAARLSASSVPSTSPIPFPALWTSVDLCGEKSSLGPSPSVPRSVRRPGPGGPGRCRPVSHRHRCPDSVGPSAHRRLRDRP